MRSYRDTEKRLADLERQTAWPWVAAERTQVHMAIDAGAVVDVLCESGALPQVEDYAGQESWLAVAPGAPTLQARSFGDGELSL